MSSRASSFSVALGSAGGNRPSHFQGLKTPRNMEFLWISMAILTRLFSMATRWQVPQTGKFRWQLKQHKLQLQLRLRAAGLWAEALAFLEEMPRHEIQPDTYIYNNAACLGHRVVGMWLVRGMSSVCFSFFLLGGFGSICVPFGFGIGRQQRVENSWEGALLSLR